MTPSYSIHLRAATIEQAVEILTQAGFEGLVLAANDHWATAVLPRSDDERGRLRQLADLHEPGVLLFNVGPEGDRIVFCADATRPAAFRDRGLLSPAVAAQMAISTPRGADWIPLLKLPKEALQSDALLRDEAPPYAGAIPVGVHANPVSLPPPRRPATGQELYATLRITGSVELLSDAPDHADGFAERLVHGAASVIEWLIEQEGVVEVFLTDDGLQAVIDELWPEQ
jgi:hypothetical protein